MTHAPAGTIRLITANLYHDRADPSALAEQLEALRVDVACLQELGERQAAAIERVLPYGKLEPGAHARDLHGMGIASRRPLEVTRLALPLRDARVATLTPRDWPELSAALELVNLHVQAPHVFPQWRALATRRAQLAALTPHLDASPDAARVVCGDLNATPLWPAYRALTARVADLVVEHAALSDRTPPPTWGPWPGAPRVLRIDHVLGRRVTAAIVQVVRIRGSDHSAVVADLVGEG